MFVTIISTVSLNMIVSRSISSTLTFELMEVEGLQLSGGSSRGRSRRTPHLEPDFLIFMHFLFKNLGHISSIQLTPHI